MNSNLKRKEVVLGIIHTSLGELQWLVAHLYKVHEQFPDFEYVLLFFSKKVYQKALEEKTHLEEFKRIGYVIHKRNILSFLLKSRKNVNSIYKDFWPIYRTSLAAAIRFCCPQATMYLYPHSNAIYSIPNNDFDSKQESYNIKHDTKSFDFILLNTQLDKIYWSKRVPIDKIKVIGSAPYQSKWLERILDSSSEELNRIKSLVGKKKLIAIFTRPASGDFLDIPDYQHLIRSIASVFGHREDCFLVFKQHPREEPLFLKSELEKVGLTEYILSGLNPFLLCSEAFLSISFWSSTITDSLSVNCPAIEFFRYHTRGNDKWFAKQNEEYGSFYKELGLCLDASSEIELSDHIQKIVDDRDGVLSEQKMHLDQVFQLDTYEKEALPIRDCEVNANFKLADWLRISISSFKSIFVA